MKTHIEMTGADLILHVLQALEVECIFGYPGGAVLPLYDALNDSTIRTVLVRHEQAAALAANAYGRVHKKPGVCLSTSGPGGTNMVTGIADAYADSVPMVAIAGQVATTLIGTGAFQEVDITGICMPITKRTFVITHIEDIPSVLREAFETAQSGRPGPVLVDIPKDVQSAKITMGVDWKEKFKPVQLAPKPVAQQSEWEKAIDMCKKAERPLIIAGQGCYWAHAEEEFQSFVEREQIPVITTIHGIGLLAKDHPLNFGWLGMHGMKYANLAVQRTDLIIALGIRFDDRITGKLDTFAPNAKVIHVDIDPAENAKLVRPLAFLHSDLKDALQQWPMTKTEDNEHLRRGWHFELNELKGQYPLYDSLGTGRFNQITAIQLLDKLKNPNAYVTTDVGQHQMWAGQYLTLKERRFITSGGSGTMGFCLPAAMGVQEAYPEQEVWAISGDGSFMMNMQEMSTLVQENYPIKIMVLDNAYLGMVRQWQEQFYKNRLSGVNLVNPDFEKVAAAFGIKSFKATNEAELEEAINAAKAHNGPVMIHAVVVKDDKVLPMVSPGKSLDDTLYYTDFPKEYPMDHMYVRKPITK